MKGIEPIARRRWPPAEPRWGWPAAAVPPAASSCSGGTIACGLVGGAAGFVVGLGSYVIFDWIPGDTVENRRSRADGRGGLHRPLSACPQIRGCGQGACPPSPRNTAGDRAGASCWSISRRAVWPFLLNWPSATGPWGSGRRSTRSSRRPPPAGAEIAYSEPISYNDHAAISVWGADGVLEAVANVVVGYGVAVLTQLFVVPLFALYASFGQNLAIGAVFTLLCRARHNRVYAERMVMRCRPDLSVASG